MRRSRVWALIVLASVAAMRPASAEDSIAPPYHDTAAVSDCNGPSPQQPGPVCWHEVDVDVDGRMSQRSWASSGATLPARGGGVAQGSIKARYVLDHSVDALTFTFRVHVREAAARVDPIGLAGSLLPGFGRAVVSISAFARHLSCDCAAGNEHPLILADSSGDPAGTTEEERSVTFVMTSSSVVPPGEIELEFQAMTVANVGLLVPVVISTAILPGYGSALASLDATLTGIEVGVPA